MALKDGAIFTSCYYVSDGSAGEVNVNLHLVVNTNNYIIAGVGSVTQTTNPPLDIPTTIVGSYKAVGSHMIVGLTGTDSSGDKNFDLTMALDQDWQSGTASYEFLDDSDQWRRVESEKVQKVDCPTV